MPANEFEKQVQQKMDEFQPEPSASVWQKVEEDIRKKKRRRIIFFFILPAAIALMTLSVYYFSNNGNKKNVITQKQSVSNKVEPGKTDNTEKTEITKREKENNIQPSLKKETGVSTTNTNKKAEQKASVDAGKNNVQLSAINPVSNREPAVASSKNDFIKNARKEIKQDDSLVINNDIPAKQTIIKPTADSESNKDKNIIEPKLASDSENKNDLASEQKNINPPKTDSVALKNMANRDEQKEMISKKKSTKSKLRWGIDFSTGLSGSSHNVFSLDMQKSLNDITYSIPGSATGAGGVQRTVLAPSSVYSGISFKTGITAELQVSKKSRFSAGLHYAYSSNRINTGRKQDSTINLYYNSNLASQVGVFYSGARRNKYTNRFHFIQIPLWYHWQLNKGKKLPLQWNIGMSFGYLFATNGLEYDSSYGGIYYRNKEAFNKFHVNASTGFSFRLKGKSGSEWILGPELSFDMRKLINNPLDKRRYLTYGGISTRFLFPQKKK
jgi:Outer membrane protein beta-barrel domain